MTSEIEVDDERQMVGGVSCRATSHDVDTLHVDRASHEGFI